MTLDERKASILRAVVEQYIHTAQPVGSQHVARASGVNVSSATVRNDMAALEQEGYLQQPHTSAGRVPTEKGYRFFVDSLVGPARLGSADSKHVRSFFANVHGELEELLNDTSHLLADLTRYAAVVVGPPHEAALVRSVQFVSLSERIVLLVVVLSNGAIEKHTLELEAPIDDAVLSVATTELTRQMLGLSVSAASAVAAPSDSSAGRLVEAAKRALLGGQSADSDQVFIGGASQVAGAFDAVATVSEVLRILEQQYVVVSLISDVLDRGLSVAIGTETGIAPLADCAVVVAPYEVAGETAGSIGVLGPSRMDYPQALAAVAVVSQRLGRRLTEG
ncbi:MAG: heat-inducible transcription repressor HrcA [Actinobacteria bacterium]|nr:heat-inducible transcription repressor HrcA [Actinomycetota bacterium]